MLIYRDFISLTYVMHLAQHLVQIIYSVAVS